MIWKSKIPQLPALALAAAPLIFAGLTWDHDSPSDLMQISRQLSTPITLIEIAVIFAGARAGMTVNWIYYSVPVWCRLLATVLFIQTVIIAGFFSVNPPVALMHTIMILVHVFFGFSCFYLTMKASKRSIEEWHPIAISGAVFTGLAVLFAITAPDAETYDWVYFGLAVANVRHLGVYSLVGCCAAVGISVQASSKRQMIIWSLVASVSLALSVWSGTRGSLLAITLSMTVCALFAAQYARKMMQIGLIIFPVALVIGSIYIPDGRIFGLVRVVESVVEGGKTEQSRIAMWREVPALMSERPLFGHGLGQYRFVAREAQRNYNHPHNFLAQFLVQWGMVGTAIAFIFGSVLYIVSLKRFLVNPNEAMAPFLIINGVMCMALYEGVLFYPFPLMSLAFCYAMLLGIPNTQPKQVTRTRTSSLDRIFLREKAA